MLCLRSNVQWRGECVELRVCSWKREGGTCVTGNLHTVRAIPTHQCSHCFCFATRDLSSVSLCTSDEKARRFLVTSTHVYTGEVCQPVDPNGSSITSHFSQPRLMNSCGWLTRILSSFLLMRRWTDSSTTTPCLDSPTNSLWSRDRNSK